MSSDLLRTSLPASSYLKPTYRTHWPDERHFLNHSVTQMEQWLRAWNLPTRLQVEWQHFCRQEWVHHQHHLSTHSTEWSHSELQAFRRYTKDFVVGPGAYTLPKARPIVSYTQTVSAPLSQKVASAIYCLLQVVFPDLTSLSDVLHSFVTFGAYFRASTPLTTSSSTNKTSPASSTTSLILE